MSKIRDDKSGRVQDRRTPQQRATASNRAANPGLYPSARPPKITTPSARGRGGNSQDPGSQLNYTPSPQVKGGKGGLWTTKKASRVGPAGTLVGKSASEDSRIKPVPARKPPTRSRAR
jgi:hypothetical protein